jgi:hypothetical protein
MSPGQILASAWPRPGASKMRIANVDMAGPCPLETLPGLRARFLMLWATKKPSERCEPTAAMIDRRYPLCRH